MRDMGSEETASAGVTLRIVTPCGIALETGCDSVTLPLADGQGGAGGGSMGIRRGHVRAELALCAGCVRAVTGGAVQRSVSVAGGFALVADNAVTVVTDSAKIDSCAAAAQENEALP